MKKRLLVVLLFFCSFPMFGQYLEVGPYFGGMYYLGDLNPQKHFYMMHPAYGGIVRCNFSTRWVGRLNFTFGEVSGDDQKTQAVENRNLNFNSKILEISAQAEVNFLPYFTGSKRNFFTPYLFAGIGLFTMNPTGMVNEQKYNLHELGTEGQFSGNYPDKEPYSLTQFCIPFGFGFRCAIGRGLCIGAEWSLKKTFTDYLDDCSDTYYLDSEIADFNSIAHLASDPTQNHKPGMQRGSSEYKDWYATLGLTLTYKINLFKQSDCNRFNDPSIKFK